MMAFKNISLLTLVAFLTSSCALWPYKKDFDCPIKEGLKCKSLYEISEMADKGLFGPRAKKQKTNDCECSDSKKTNSKKSANNKSEKLDRCYVG